MASSTRIAAFVRGKSKTDDNDERERKRLEKVGQVLKEWRRRRCYGMTEVLPRLFVGSMGDATDVEQLLANKVSFFFGILEIPLKKYFQDAGQGRGEGGGKKQWQCLTASENSVLIFACLPLWSTAAITLICRPQFNFKKCFGSLRERKGKESTERSLQHLECYMCEKVVHCIHQNVVK